MKIYFEDGKLKKNICDEIPYELNLFLDATYGYEYCDNLLYKMKRYNKDAIVYTNVITALRNEYAWNKELKVPEIYIRNKDGIFTRIDKLTNKELREAHNIMRMYIAGVFGNFD